LFSPFGANGFGQKMVEASPEKDESNPVFNVFKSIINDELLLIKEQANKN
jgi:hypothetical protein